MSYSPVAPNDQNPLVSIESRKRGPVDRGNIVGTGRQGAEDGRSIAASVPCLIVHEKKRGMSRRVSH